MSLTAKKIFYGIALTIAAVAFFGCSQPVDPPADLTWTAEADGVSGTTTSTQINLTFAGAVTGLTAEQITLTNGTGAATKGALTGSGADWSLGLTVGSAGDLTLAIDKAGVESGPKTVTVHKQAAAPDPVAYIATADGASGAATSTKIDFTFAGAVAGLTAEQITLTNGTGTATKGALTGSGENWSLAITVDSAGDLTVAISKTGVENGAKTVTVHKQGEATPVAYTITADGDGGVTSSTKIEFTFAGAVTELTAAQITLTNGTGAATKGALTGSDTSWSLEITVDNAGDITVAIDKTGIESGAKTVTVHKQGEATPDPVTYTVTADGASGVTTSTKIDFAFNAAIEGLTAEQITLTNGTGTVTRGDLTGNDTSWSLEITVDKAGDITVAIDKPGIEDTEKELTVHKAPEGPALTAAVQFATINENGWVTGSPISGDGETQTLALAIVEEPAAYFVILKAAEQTIEVSGADEGKVKKLENGESIGSKTASDTQALFSVNIEDLLFDGAFGESGTFNADAIPTGTETRSFTLTVSEEDKAPREIAVSLNITLDPDTETSIYHREGEPGAYYYTKVRDAALTKPDIVTANFDAFNDGPVMNLQNAFVWVDRYGESGPAGVPAGFANGTTEGYSEYRLFLKKSQKIGKLNFVIIGEPLESLGKGQVNEPDTRDNLSIEFYGAGSPGTKEQKITANPSYFTNETEYQYNGSSIGISSVGFISLLHRRTEKYKALVLGKNITIDAENAPFSGSNNANDPPWSLWGVRYLIDIGKNALVIMNEHSKLTGCTVKYATLTFCPVMIEDGAGSYNGKFIMNSGAIITGNIVNYGVIEKRSLGIAELKPGAIITDNWNYDKTAEKNGVYEY